jgi:hypothetical protein
MDQTLAAAPAPSPTHARADRGAQTVSGWFLALAALLEIVAGCIHYFLPDGGAGTIAHIDLTTRRETIVAVFAWFGALQIASGALVLVIALRYRALVPLGLAWIALSRGLMAVDAWFGKGAHGDHHPPEHFASPIALVLALAFLAVSLRRPARDR